MARILNVHNSRWYDELNSVAFYDEAEFEGRIFQHAQEIFPHHFVFPFKKEVVAAGETAGKKPDIGLIRKDFGDWAIVEVEIDKHPLDHVLEQTKVFVNGDYNAPAMAEYVKKQLLKVCKKRVSAKRLRRLFNAKAPDVLVVVDAHDTRWQQQLKENGVALCVFETYKNASGQFVYRTFGEYPVFPAEEAHCRVSMPNVLEVIGDIQFSTAGTNFEVEVTFDEQLTRWILFSNDGRQYLRLVGRSNPPSPTGTYGLFKDKADRYFFVRS